jgi:hypothetical protein
MRPRAKNIHEDLPTEPDKRTRIQFSLASSIAEILIKLVELYQCTPGEVARMLTIKVTNQELESVQGHGICHAKH